MILNVRCNKLMPSYNSYTYIYIYIPYIYDENVLHFDSKLYCLISICVWCSMEFISSINYLNLMEYKCIMRNIFSSLFNNFNLMEYKCMKINIFCSLINYFSLMEYKRILRNIFRFLINY